MTGSEKGNILSTAHLSGKDFIKNQPLNASGWYIDSESGYFTKEREIDFKVL